MEAKKKNTLWHVIIAVLGAIIIGFLAVGIVVSVTSGVPKLSPAAYEEQKEEETSQQGSAEVEQNLESFGIGG